MNTFARMNGRLIYNLLAWAAIAILLVTVLQQCSKLENCCECTGSKARVDTIPVHDTLFTEQITVPKPRFTRQQLKEYIQHGTLPARDSVSSVFVTTVLPQPGGSGTLTVDACSDTVYYIDTMSRKDDYLVVMEEHISGNKITFRKFDHANLKPEIRTTITNTVMKKETVRVYAGAFAGFNKPYNAGQWNWIVGPQLQVTIPIGLSAGYGFDAKNNGHVVNLLYKIKLRK